MGIPFMADDLSGSDIRVPSFLISLWEAQKLKDCYMTAAEVKDYVSASGIKCEPGTPIMTTLQWGMPSPDGNVEWELWTSSDTEHNFKAKFKDYATASGLFQHTSFTPHYMTYDGDRWCPRVPDKNCGNLCYNNKYCHPDPDCAAGRCKMEDFLEGVPGKDVVEENLRQLCVWKKANETYAQDGAAKWWQYVVLFDEQCHGIGGGGTVDKFNAACSEQVHKQVPGLSYAETVQCIKDAESAGDGTNALLEAEKNFRSRLNIMADPTVIVNNVIERGVVNVEAVSGTICAGFLSGTEPALCDCIDEHYGSPNVMTLCKCAPNAVNDVFCPYDNSCAASVKDCPSGQSSLGWWVAGIVIVAASAAGVAGFVYWRRAKQQMRNEVRNILAEYMPL